MKMIGLVGGMSWESSIVYYEMINRSVRERLGGSHSARSLMVSVDFEEIERLQNLGAWAALTQHMIGAAVSLERGGADFIVICSNTMHRMAEEIEAAISLPLLHIADPTGAAICASGCRRVGLLGTAFTMEQTFYRRRLEDRFGLDVLVPDDADRALVHRIIYTELILGQVHESSREAYRQVIGRLLARGAEAIILGCTEIMLLIGQEHSSSPIFNTTQLHAEAAVTLALNSDDVPVSRL